MAISVPSTRSLLTNFIINTSLIEFIDPVFKCIVAHLCKSARVFFKKLSHHKILDEAISPEPNGFATLDCTAIFSFRQMPVKSRYLQPQKLCRFFRSQYRRIVMQSRFNLLLCQFSVHGNLPFLCLLSLLFSAGFNSKADYSQITPASSCRILPMSSVLNPLRYCRNRSFRMS